jgi:hypothetical protein
MELEIRRGFTAFQFMTILGEVKEMAEYASQELSQTAQGSLMLLFSSGVETPPLEDPVQSDCTSTKWPNVQARILFMMH